MAVEIALLSPEKTVLTYRLAGVGSRLLAHVVDAMIVVFGLYLLFVLVGTIASLLMPGAGADAMGPVSGLFVVLFTLGPFAYFILFEGLWNGQTIGKKLAGIRVRMADGTPITFAASTARNFLRVADFLPFVYFLGVVSMFVNPKLQRIGDLVAGTVVTHEDKVTTSFSVAPHRVGIHPLESMVGELRNMTDAQYYVLRRYCDRFPELPVEVQTKLTDTVWLPLAKNLGVEMKPDIHLLFLAEAVVMKYGRVRGLL